MRDFDSASPTDDDGGFPSNEESVRRRRPYGAVSDSPFDNEADPPAGPHSCLLLISAAPLAILLFLGRDLWRPAVATGGAPAWALIGATLLAVLLVRRIWWLLVAGSVLALICIAILMFMT